jgi:hypothetical protein
MHGDTLRHVDEQRSPTAGVQRSFRLSPRTLELLDQEAAESNVSRNALVDRVLGEGLRLTHHPLIRFRSTADGARLPMVAGSRFSVYQVIATLRDSGGSLEEVTENFALSPQQVRAARDYYADFREEVDGDEARAHRIEQRERERWERQQQALS